MAEVAEQQDENAVIDDTIETDPPGDKIENEIEENEIVIAGQDEETESKSDPKDHILKRVMRRKDKLQGENEDLKTQLQQLANQNTQVVAPRPDEFAFDDRADYLAADAKWHQELLSTTVSQQLNVQQDGHRVAAAEQQREAKIELYATTAANLKVSDFNDLQDKAFEILGDEFAQLLVENLPKQAPSLVCWFANNPVEAARYRDDYKSNPGNTTFELGLLAGKLTKQPKRTQAANPEVKIEGAGMGGVETDWQTKLDKIDNDADMSNLSKALRARRQVKAEAKAAGFDVSTLK